MNEDLLQVRKLVESRMLQMEREGEITASVELNCLLSAIDSIPEVQAGIRFNENQAKESIDKMSLLDASIRMPELIAPEFHPSKGLLMRVFTFLDQAGYELVAIAGTTAFHADSLRPKHKVSIHGRIFTTPEGTQELGLQIFNDYGTRTCHNGRLTRAEQIISILETIA